MFLAQTRTRRNPTVFMANRVRGSMSVSSNSVEVEYKSCALCLGPIISPTESGCLVAFGRSCENQTLFDTVHAQCFELLSEIRLARRDFDCEELITWCQWCPGLHYSFMQVDEEKVEGCGGEELNCIEVGSECPEENLGQAKLTSLSEASCLSPKMETRDSYQQAVATDLSSVVCSQPTFVRTVNKQHTLKRPSASRITRKRYQHMTQQGEGTSVVQLLKGQTLKETKVAKALSERTTAVRKLAVNNLGAFIVHCVRLRAILKIPPENASDVQRELRLGAALRQMGLPWRGIFTLLYYDHLLRRPNVTCSIHDAVHDVVSQARIPDDSVVMEIVSKLLVLSIP